MNNSSIFSHIEGVTYFPGNDGSNRSVCIMGSIHGNERIGAAVLDELKPILASANLKKNVYLILGNPEGYRRDVRFVDTDMNRLFGAEKSGGESIEEKRANEIALVLAGCDYLLDIHSTIKPSVPFVYCEPDDAHMALATLMGTRYIVGPGTDFRPADLVSSADNYVDRHGGIGITYESGWHKDELVIDDVVFRAKLFIQKAGACDFGLIQPKNTINSKHLVMYNHVIPQSTSFSFSHDFKNFDTVMKDEIIAHDGAMVIRAERDSYIIFPKKDIQQGKVACYLSYS